MSRGSVVRRAKEPHVTIPAGLLEEANESLDLLLKASLPEDEWHSVRGYLDQLAEGFRKDDAVSINSAIQSLERFGSTRVATRVGGKGVLPTASIREYVNRLIHELDLLRINGDGSVEK